ncbi:MAG: NAD(P)-dependent oxidoreductase [Candidatus Saccharimonadales bacterium]
MGKAVAVLGLGIMGHGIADNFLKGGYSVVVWNRTPEKAKDLVQKGAKLAGSVSEAVQDADIIFEVTANDESSKSVWLGEGGIIENAKPEQYLVSCATISAAWADELAAQCTEKGLTFFDIPMTGGRVAAESGQLTLLAGGSKEKLDEITADLQAIAKEVKYFGKVGSGMRYKLILNGLQAIHIAGLGEALRIAKEAGLDLKLVGDALAERPGGVITNITWNSYQKEPEQTTFSVEWTDKDLGYAAQLAGTTAHPLITEVKKQYDSAIEQGYAQADWTKINRLYMQQ